MPTDINITTFLVGSTAKNDSLSIEEMDNNIINLKVGIQSVEDALTLKIDSDIDTERSERITAIADEVVARQAGDTLIDGRLTSIENTYLKKDGSVPLSGDLDVNNKKLVNVGNPVNAGDAVNKSYLETTASLYYSNFVELSSNITLNSASFPSANNTLYFLPSTASASRILTLPAPTTVAAGTKIHLANWSTTSGRTIQIASTASSIRTETGQLASSRLLYSLAKLVLVSDGQYWIMHRSVHNPANSNMWNDGVVTIRSTGESFLGKTVNLKSVATGGNDNSTVDFSIQTTGTQLKISQDAVGGTSLLTIDRATGKVFQDTNAPITDATQLVTKDHIDKNVIATSGVVNKVVPITYIKTDKDISKPAYPSLTASDFGNVVRYRMESLGAAYTTLPEISTLTGSKRINLINISNDTLANPGGVAPGYAIHANITIFPSGTNKIVGISGSIFTANGAVRLDAGDTAELLAINSNEWMLISHSSVFLGSRLSLDPHNRLMIHAGINANGTIATYVVDSTTRSYLWTKPNNLVGNGSGIIFTTSKISTGKYQLNWLNPNYWQSGNTAILAPTATASINFSGVAPSTGLNIKVEELSAFANGCKVNIRDDSGNNYDAPFSISIYGQDV